VYLCAFVPVCGAVFTFIPTAVELVLVCGLLGRHTSISFAAVVLLTFSAYVAWTVALTKASVSIRKEVRSLLPSPVAACALCPITSFLAREGPKVACWLVAGVQDTLEELEWGSDAWEELEALLLLVVLLLLRR